MEFEYSYKKKASSKSILFKSETERTHLGHNSGH